MIAVFTADYKDEEDGKDHPNRIPDLPDDEEVYGEKKEKKRGSRRKHKHRGKGTKLMKSLIGLESILF